jgi:hypothetical protein
MAFPPQSAVIVDTTFMSHTFSNVIRRRARAAHETLFLEDRFGVGGLAQRLTGVSERQLSPTALRAALAAQPPAKYLPEHSRQLASDCVVQPPSATWRQTRNARSPTVGRGS